jgi:hypothetical protein
LRESDLNRITTVGGEFHASEFHHDGLSAIDWRVPHCQAHLTGGRVTATACRNAERTRRKQSQNFDYRSFPNHFRLPKAKAFAGTLSTRS